MIPLTCTKCQTAMELDDAFAGGVCRCRQCGAIQTVPSPASDSPKPKHRKPPSAPNHRRSASALRITAILFMILIIAILLYWLGQH